MQFSILCNSWPYMSVATAVWSFWCYGSISDFSRWVLSPAVTNLPLPSTCLDVLQCLSGVDKTFWFKFSFFIDIAQNGFSPSGPLHVPHKVLRSCVPHAYLQHRLEPIPRASPRPHVWRQPPRELIHPGAGSCSGLLFPCHQTVRWSSQACSTQSSMEGFWWAAGTSPALTVAHSQRCIALCSVGSALRPTAIRCLTAPISNEQVSNGKGSSCVFFSLVFQ